MRPLNVLFVCSRNRLRSPTAEQVFADWPGIETDSAGLAPDAEQRMDADQLAWADLIMVMEKTHRTKLTRQFGRHLSGKRVICLDIADRYAYMAPDLVALLIERAGPHLR